MFFDNSLFFARTSLFIFLYLVLIVMINFIEIFSFITKNINQLLRIILPFLILCVPVSFLYLNTDRFLLLIPVCMLWWTGILIISNFINFWQYKKEQPATAFRSLIGVFINISFGIPFAILIYRNRNISVNLIGIYLIILGITLLFDGLAKVVPSKYRNRFKRKIRITPPAFMTAFVPIIVINTINSILKIENDEPIKVKRKNANCKVEIFVHSANTLKGTGGHVDINIDGTIICYGTYDKEDIKLGGIIGAGVFYEVYNKEEYIHYCKNTKKERLFGYEIALTDEELQKMKDRWQDFKSRSNVWKCKAQIAMEKGEDASQYKQSPCMLSKATRTVFYKMNSGAYRYYWILGNNCVKFTDDFLKACGIPSLMNGIITPGTYLTFLNSEFEKGSNHIVSKTIY